MGKERYRDPSPTRSFPGKIIFAKRIMAYRTLAISLSAGKKLDPSSRVVRMLLFLINPSCQNTCHRAIFKAGKEAKGTSARPRGQAECSLSARL